MALLTNLDGKDGSMLLIVNLQNSIFGGGEGWQVLGKKCCGHPSFGHCRSLNNSQHYDARFVVYIW